MAEVIWLHTAQSMKNEILLYGLLIFGENSVRKLLSTFEKYDTILSNNPYIGRTEQQLEGIAGHSYRSVLIHKNYRLIYYVYETHDVTRVVIAYVVDTRSNPETLPERLKNAVGNEV